MRRTFLSTPVSERTTVSQSTTRMTRWIWLVVGGSVRKAAQLSATHAEPTAARCETGSEKIAPWSILLCGDAIWGRREIGAARNGHQAEHWRRCQKAALDRRVVLKGGLKRVLILNCGCWVSWNSHSRNTTPRPVPGRSGSRQPRAETRISLLPIRL